MGLKEKLRDFGSKIVSAFKKKPKIDHGTIQRWKDSGAFSHRVGGKDGRNPFAGMTKEQIEQKKAEFKAQHPEIKGL